MAAVHSVGQDSVISALRAKNDEQARAFAAALKTAATVIDEARQAPSESSLHLNYEPILFRRSPINFLQNSDDNAPTEELELQQQQSLTQTDDNGQDVEEKREPVAASDRAAGNPPVPPEQPPAPPVSGESPEPDPESHSQGAEPTVTPLTKARRHVSNGGKQIANAGKWVAKQDWRFGVQARLRSGVASQISQSSGLGHLLQEIPVDDIKVGQPTWKAWGAAIGTKGNWHLLPEAIKQAFHTPKEAAKIFKKWVNETVTTSVRPREDLNTTVAQLGLAFMSKQTAFQFKGSDLLMTAEQVLFADDGSSALYVIPRSAKVVGDAVLGNGKVIELTYSLGVKADTNVTLQPGEVSFFGEGAKNAQGFARLDGNLTYTKLFEEIKTYPTAGIGPLAKLLPVRLRTEIRPEVPGRRVISNGKIVSRQFLVQNQAVLERARLKLQFTVDGQTDLTAFVKDPSVAAIHQMVRDGLVKVFDEKGGFDGTLVRSWVPSHTVVGDGGLRLSAVNEKPAFKTMTDLTGRKSLQWDEAQTNLDVVFQDPLTMPRMAAWLSPVLSPDRWVSHAGYAAGTWIAQKVTGLNNALPSWLQFKRGLGYISDKLPSWLQFKTPPTHYLPTPGAVFEAMTGNKHQFGATSGTRFTLSIQSPNFNLIPFTQLLAGSVEGRAQLKTEEQQVAPAIRKNGRLVPREFTDVDTGLNSVAQVPGWLGDLIDSSQQTRSHLVVPKGAYESLNDFLNQIDNGSSQETAIRDFRDALLPLFLEPTAEKPNLAYTGFLSPTNLGDIDKFLSRFANVDPAAQGVAQAQQDLHVLETRLRTQAEALGAGASGSTSWPGSPESLAAIDAITQASIDLNPQTLTEMNDAVNAWIDAWGAFDTRDALGNALWSPGSQVTGDQTAALSRLLNDDIAFTAPASDRDFYRFASPAAQLAFGALAAAKAQWNPVVVNAMYAYIAHALASSDQGLHDAAQRARDVLNAGSSTARLGGAILSADESEALGKLIAEDIRVTQQAEIDRNSI